MTNGKIVVGRVCKHWIAEKGSLSIDCVYLHAISGISAALDRRSDAIAAIYHIARNANVLCSRDRRPGFSIGQKQITDSNLKSTIVAEYVIGN